MNNKFPNELDIEDAFRQTMNEIGHLLDYAFNKNKDPKVTGFALFVFPFGQGKNHRSNYISNANRTDIIATLKEFIARAENRLFEGTSEAKQ